MWLYVSLLAVTLATLVHVFLTWTFNYWQKRGVPFVQPSPLFGNFKDSSLFRKTLGDVYVDLYRQLRGHSFGGFFKFRQPCLMICDPDLAKQILVKDFASFHDNDIDITVEMDPMMGRNPFALRGERWKTVRSQLTPAFTSGKLKPLFPLISDVCREMREHLESEQHPDGLEAKELAAKYATDVTATCIFGVSGNSFTDPDAEFIQVQRDMAPSGWVESLKFSTLFVAPSIAKMFKFSFFNPKVADFFRRVSKDVMRHREENHVVRKDFLQLFMTLKARGSVEDDQSGEKFTDEDVAAQSLTFFSDGSETSSGALSFTLYELALNPEHQTRLRAEVDAAFNKHGELCYDLLQDVPYADMVLAEGLRMYPIIPFLTRLCTRPYELDTPDGGTYRVEVNTPVVVPVLGFHRDPALFPDPDRFDPERFAEENRETWHPFAYLAFGAGPRGCLGMRFAKLQMKAALTSLVSQFEIRVCPRTVPVVLDTASLLLLAERGLWLRFVPRH